MNNMKLRVCLTDVCNFRCAYCRSGGEGVSDHNYLLSDIELLEIMKNLSTLGFEAFRLTGGEPLLRKNWDIIAKEAKNIQGIKKVTIVTNGSLLTSENIEKILSVGFKSVTVSLDTIQSEGFRNLVGRDCLQTVINGIKGLKQAGANVKINSVISKRNIDDVWGLIDFCNNNSINLKILDLVGMDDTYWKQEYVPLGELKAILESKSISTNIQYQDEGFGTPETVYLFGNIKVVVKDSTLGTCYVKTCGDCKNYPCQSGIVSMLLTHNGFLKFCSLNDNFMLDVKSLLNGDPKIKTKIQNVISMYNTAQFREKAWKYVI